MPEAPAPTSPAPSKLRAYLARFGIGAFLFFTIKGLLWLIIPALIVAWRA